MKLYKPVFDKKWKIEELESNLLRRIPGSHDTVCYYKKNVGFYGALYNTYNIFKTREAAQMWIHKEVVPHDLFYSFDKQEDMK